jgi:5-formyltetrahydrofolate cyclo-ligase
MAAMATKEGKASARKELKAVLKKCSQEELAEQSKGICSAILHMPIYKAANTIVAYLSSAKLREVETNDIVQEALARGVKLYVPVVDDSNSNMRMLHLDSLECVKEVPPFGIREPFATYSNGCSRSELFAAGDIPDLVLLPGLGFDKSCRRLGRGGGYYDKFLVRLGEFAKGRGVPRPKLVGLSFQEQMLKMVPVDEHDQICDVVVTPSESFVRDS